MNSPEKIAGAYLRLNGFFLLPHFTLFDGERHSHVDYLGLRAPNSTERFGQLIFPLDDSFFEVIDETCRFNSRARLIAAIVEVKGGQERESPGDGHIQYINNFIGPQAVAFKCLFLNQGEIITQSNNIIQVPLRYSLNWIIARIDWIDQNKEGLSKKGSWTWSETFLSDILYIKKLGFLNKMD